MNCSSLELSKAKLDAYYALKCMNRTIRAYEKLKNKFNIMNNRLDKAELQKKIIINNKNNINNKEKIVKLDIKNIQSKMNTLSISHEKRKQLEIKLENYDLELEQLNLQFQNLISQYIDINKIIDALYNTLSNISNTIRTDTPYYKGRWLVGWLELKKHNEIYEYECIKRLTFEFIINNNNKTKILFELENWKNKFSKISNSVYAIEDPYFRRPVGCLSNTETTTIFLSDSEYELDI
uniref:Uncharacterized protein n=1 Tax=viral metagenome TaxID=1070528 RepID=A0A6C0H865_9ZZZZ